MIRATAILCILLIASVSATFNFVSIGDWGCVPIGGYHEQDELIVARSFQASATDLNPRFVLNTGDNFYYCGIHSKDDALWNSTFEDVFTAESTMVPWYSCLGNHDYGYPGSATAQMEYKSPKNDRWVMPDRYYYRRLSFPGEVNISLLVLDATPCQADYVSSNPKGWDPCGSVIPGCPGCTFHENVIKQSCSTQLSWLNQILPTIPQDDWKIVMVHAPAADINVEDLISPLQQYNFQLYINGHVHLLSHYTIDNKGTYITTGAGCMVRVPGTTSSSKGDSSSSSSWDAETMAKVRNVKWSPSSCPSSSDSTHTCQIVWEQTIAGYTTHSFSEDFSKLYTYIYDYDGHLLHTATTLRNGGSDSSSSSHNTPASSSSSNSDDSCCYYKTETCHSGQTCCNEEGHSYDENTCKGDTGKHHDCKWTGSKCVVY